MRLPFRMTSSYRRSRVAIAIDARFLSCFFPLPALFHIHKRPDTKRNLGGHLNLTDPARIRMDESRMAP